MGIKSVIAKIECDGCGKTYDITLDLSEKFTPFQKDLTIVVDEAVHAGMESGGDGFISLQSGLHLCSKCTCIADGDHDIKEQPSAEQIKAAIAEWNKPNVWFVAKSEADGEEQRWKSGPYDAQEAAEYVCLLYEWVYGKNDDGDIVYKKQEMSI